MTGREEELAEVARWAEGIEQVHSCIAGRFRRPEPRRRVLDYLRGLVSSRVEVTDRRTKVDWAQVVKQRRAQERVAVGGAGGGCHTRRGAAPVVQLSVRCGPGS